MVVHSNLMDLEVASKLSRRISESLSSKNGTCFLCIQPEIDHKFVISISTNEAILPPLSDSSHVCFLQFSIWKWKLWWWFSFNLLLQHCDEAVSIFWRHSVCRTISDTPFSPSEAILVLYLLFVPAPSSSILHYCLLLLIKNGVKRG